jgi:hypothetical protein
MMPEFLTILILALSAIVVATGLLYALAMIAMSVAAGVEAIVVTAEHRAQHIGPTVHSGHTAHTGHTIHA